MHNNKAVNTLNRAVNLCSFYGIALIGLELLIGMLFVYLGASGSFYSYIITNVVLSVCCIFLPSVLLSAAAGGVKRCLSDENVHIGKVDMVLLVFFGLGACMTLNFLVSELSLFLPFFSTQGTAHSGNDIGSLMLLTAASAVVPAVSEEFAFRGAVYSLLSKNGGFGVFISAVFFGIIHSGVSAVIFAFLSGIVFGYIRRCSGKLLPSVIVHFCNNAIAVLISYLGNIYGEGISDMAFMSVSVASVAMMIVSFVLLRYRGVRVFSLSETKGEMPFRDKCAAVLRSPLMWLFIVFAVVVKLF